MSKKLIYFFSRIEEILCAGFLSAMISIVILNVLLRYIFSYSMFWAEEVSTICFVWAVFIGASATYKHKMDLGIDILILKAPKTVQRVVRVLVEVILLVLNGFIFFMAVDFSIQSLPKPTAVLGVSSLVFNGALVVGFGLITIHTIRFMVRDVQVFISKSRARGNA